MIVILPPAKVFIEALPLEGVSWMNISHKFVYSLNWVKHFTFDKVSEFIV